MNLIPNWLVCSLLIVIAVWRINEVRKFRDHNIFLKKVGGDWINKTKLNEAIKTYIYLEVLFFSLLPVFGAITYIEFLHPYLGYIGFMVFGPIICAGFCWVYYYSAKRP